MSDPKRYEHMSDGMGRWFINPKTGKLAPYGDYVLHSDYARLKAEVERLTNLKSGADYFEAKEGKPSEQKSPSFIEDLGNGVEKHDLLFRYPAKKGKQV